jgi:hypothetical protein
MAQPASVRIGKESFADYLRLQQAADKELRDILRSAARAAGREVAKLPGNTVSEQVRRAQYQQARLGIHETIDAMWSETGQSIAGNMPQAVGIANDAAADIIDALGKGIDPELIRGMEASARNAAERVNSRLISRIDLSPRVYKNAALSKGKIDAIVNESLALGRSAREIAQLVMQYILPNTSGGASYAAMRLGRTELNNAFHAANLENYKDHPWVVGVQWWLSGSHPRNDICNDLASGGEGDGFYLPNQVPSKPHPQCLCYTTAATPSATSFRRNLLSGDYDDWLLRQGLQPLG